LGNGPQEGPGDRGNLEGGLEHKLGEKWATHRSPEGRGEMSPEVKWILRTMKMMTALINPGHVDKDKVDGQVVEDYSQKDESVNLA